MRNFTQEYKYDQIGNLLQMKSNGVWTRDYMYNFATNNHLLKHDENATINSYEYDTHGNTTKMPHLPEMKYDYADQLNEVTLNASGNKAYYIYNAEGERVRKVIEKGNIKEERFYVGDYEVYTKKTNGTLNVERETLHINDDKSKVALIDYDGTNTTIRYQYTNHLDSASLELDETGGIITYEEYHPFGTTSYRSGRNEIDVSLKRYKYVHKELDNETGLYYYGMRYYAPWIARFISVDPLQFKYPELTSFQYASNAPISNIDLDGAEGQDVVDAPNLPPDVVQRISNPDAYREEGTKKDFYINIGYGDGPGKGVKDPKYWHSGSEDTKAGWYRLGAYVKINDVENFAFNLARASGSLTPQSASEIYGSSYEVYVQNAQNELLELSDKYNYSDTFFKIIGDNYSDFVAGYNKLHGEAIQEISMLDIVLTVTGGAAVVKGASKLAIKQALKRKVSKNILVEVVSVKSKISAYEEALEVGGKHHGWLKNMLGRPEKQLSSGITSMEANIIEHQNLISNPAKYLKQYNKGNWNLLDPRQQKHLLNVKWPGDIQRAKEQINILQGILKNR